MKLSKYQEELYGKHVNTTEFKKMGEKTTVALLTLNNGFEIVGTSACVDPKEFDETIGEYYALVHGLNELDKYIGYHRQEERYLVEHYLIKEAW